MPAAGSRSWRAGAAAAAAARAVEAGARQGAQRTRSARPEPRSPSPAPPPARPPARPTASRPHPASGRVWPFAGSAFLGRPSAPCPGPRPQPVFWWRRPVHRATPVPAIPSLSGVAGGGRRWSGWGMIRSTWAWDPGPWGLEVSWKEAAGERSEPIAPPHPALALGPYGPKPWGWAHRWGPRVETQARERREGICSVYLCGAC